MTAKSEKDQLAREVADLRIAFDLALSDKRKYPVAEFNAFLESARRYIKVTAGDSMVHKSVVQAVSRPQDLSRSFTIFPSVPGTAAAVGLSPANPLRL